MHRRRAMLPTVAHHVEGVLMATRMRYIVPKIKRAETAIPEMMMQPRISTGRPRSMARGPSQELGRASPTDTFWLGGIWAATQAAERPGRRSSEQRTRAKRVIHYAPFSTAMFPTCGSGARAFSLIRVVK